MRSGNKLFWQAALVVVTALLAQTVLAFKGESVKALGGVGAQVVQPVQAPMKVSVSVDRQQAAAARPDLTVQWDASSGVPASVRGADLLGDGAKKGVGKVAAVTDDAVLGVRAIGVMSQLKGLYGIQEAAQEFRQGIASRTEAGYRHVRLDQMYQGLPVFGGQVIVHFDGQGTARSVNGRYRPVAGLGTAAAVTADQALTTARADQQALANPVGAVGSGPSLVVYARNVDPKLAWQLVLTYDNGQGVVGRWRYWIDALTGEILFKYNDIPHATVPDPVQVLGVPVTVSGDILTGEGGGTVSVEGWSQGGLSYLYSFTNLWYVRNYGGGSHFLDEDAFTYANRTGTTSWAATDRSEMSAARALQGILNYYKTVHGRSSFDNAGSLAPAYVHYGSDYVNAFWSGTAFYIGDGDGVNADPLGVVDIMAHELQHGVTEYSADLIYYGESGQLNESFSDIFGFLSEFAMEPDGRAAYPARIAGASDWLMGEDSWLSSTALRDMRNPANTNTVGVGIGNQQPTRYHGTYWYDGWDDNGGVHLNNSIQNYYFYLLCEGGQGTNDGAIVYVVPPAGIPAGEKLAYATLTGYMTPDTDYAAARDAWVACAMDLDEAGVTTNAVISVSLAWAAVGIGTASYVFPSDPFVSGGEPASSSYFISNKVYKVVRPSLTNAVTWDVSTDVAWLKIDPVSVLVSNWVVMAVTVSVDQVVADALPVGVYRGTITFTNDTGMLAETREALLHIASNYTVRGETYDWINPLSGGHARQSVRSGVSIPYALPFDVMFYGETNRTLYVSSAGLVCFSPTNNNASTDNQTLPDWRLPNNIICPLWGDINSTDPFASMYIGVEGSEPNRRLVVTWLNVPAIADSDARFSFQAIIEENAGLPYDNDIVFNYQNVAEGRTLGMGAIATVGIEDAYGALYRQFSHNIPWLLNGSALRFTHNPAVDTTAPVGQISVLGRTGSTVSFEVRFNEPVTGLTTNGLSLAGSTVPGVYISRLSGGGFRYVVEVGNVSALGRVRLSVLGAAVFDYSGNPNAPFGPATYVVPATKVDSYDGMEFGMGGWTVTTQAFEFIDTRGWAWGVPTFSNGPVAAASPVNCWGTTLHVACSPYMSNARLTSAPIWVDEHPVLRFQMWCNVGSFATLEANAGTGWIDVTPFGDYGPYLFNTNAAWAPVTVDLSGFDSQTIQVRFTAYAYYSGKPGLYIDDVTVSSDRDPGVWVVAYTPSNGAPSSTIPVTLTAYNSSTNICADVHGVPGSPELGVSFTSGVPVVYGTMDVGELVSGAPVGLVLGSIGNFTMPVVQLTHVALLGVTNLGQQTLPFRIDGVTAAVATNALTVKCVQLGIGVTNWIGDYLLGDGGPTSCLYQVIYAGANGTNDPPMPNGQVTGDDRLLYASGTGLPWGEFGGGGVPADAGQFKWTFYHGLPAGARVYVRAFDGSSFGTAVAYGDSPFYTLTNLQSQTRDFGGWGVGAALDPLRDSNGDTISDGLAIQHGMDPREPFAPLTPGWNFKGQYGSKGSGQFGASIPSPTRVVYKGDFLYALDTGRSKIQAWNRRTGSYLGSYGSSGTGNGQFSQPYGLGLDPRPGTNRLAVVDQGNFRVQVLNFNPTTGTNITFAFAFGGSNVFLAAKDVAIAPDGRFYVTDEFSVRVFAADGSLQSTLASGGTNAGSVMRPWGVTVADDGRVVVADTENNRLQCWNSAGTWLWATGTQGAAAGQLNMPKDMAFGPGGRIYVADTGNSRLAVYSANGSYIANIGLYNFSGDMQMTQPYSLVPVVDSNLVYVADTLNNRVLLVSAIFDGDGDGMDDVWELLHGLDPTNPNDAGLDFNGNGISNLGEYRLQQDPGLGVVITAFSVNPQVLRWQSVSSGGVYQVQYAHGPLGLLSTNNWQGGPTVTSHVAGALSVTNMLTLTNTVQFIRVLKVGP
jgi:bacillolysin